ncbi:Uncharacterised protein [Vibrio cholerae]|nr:Uncharacterised protein [Vibrio cholerae]
MGEKLKQLNFHLEKRISRQDTLALTLTKLNPPMFALTRMRQR